MDFVLAVPRLLFATVVLALQQLWVNRIRALLTTLGIIIGVASTITIVGGTQGLKSYVLEQFETFGATRFVVFPRRPREALTRFSPQQVQLKYSEFQKLVEQCPSILRATPIKGFATSVQFGDRVERNVQVSGQDEDWHLIEGRAVTIGRPFTRIDDEQRRHVCIVNDKAIQELGLNEDPTGQTILVDGRRFVVIGVVETKTLPQAFGGGEPFTEVFIPFGVANAMKPEPVYGIIIQGSMKDAKLFPDLEAEIRMTLRRIRGLKPEDPDTFAVRATEQAIEMVNRTSMMMTIVAVCIAGISLLVGGIGIMNIMLASVSERTREIGLRKAVGAQPIVILMQFLVEAVVLCFIGAAIGLFLGLTMVSLARAIPNGPMAGATVPVWAMAVAVGVSAATGVVFGFFPAFKAARLNPIDALRHE